MPHLRPAFLLDVVFALVTRDVSDGKLEHIGVPPIVETEDHIQALRHHIHAIYLEKAKLSQFYTCNIEKYVLLFSEKVRLNLFLPKYTIENLLNLLLFLLIRFYSLGSYWKATDCIITPG